MTTLEATPVKTVKIPGPEHPITIIPNPARVVVTVGGRVIANTKHALTLTEASYPPIQYIPRADVNMSQLVLSKLSTYCPFKGEATYYSIITSGERKENAVWSYEEAYDSVNEINGYLAFYAIHVDSIEELEV